MNKEHLLHTLDANVDVLNTFVRACGDYNPDSVETSSFMAGAADAYSIIAEAIRNGDFDFENSDPSTLF